MSAQQNTRSQGGRLLEVRKLSVSFPTDDGVVQAVKNLSFALDRGETLGLVGESGSGKSVSCLALLGLLGTDTAQVSGQALFGGQDILRLPEHELRSVRGRRIAMIFQDPFASLHPMYRVGDQVSEAVRAHEKLSRRAARERAVELLHAVGIPRAREASRDYPHQYSGGMRQRALIAMALAHGPDVLIADEPTTALDVTIQAQILELIEDVKREIQMGVILVTHDLGVIAQVADRVLVMYAGRTVETGATADILHRPRHPYTWGLLDSLPRVDIARGGLVPIDGLPPSMISVPSGCAFHPRCPYRFERCDREEPPLVDLGAGRADACLLPQEARSAARKGRKAEPARVPP